jgi:hypothetical protein
MNNKKNSIQKPKGPSSPGLSLIRTRSKDATPKLNLDQLLQQQEQLEGDKFQSYFDMDLVTSAQI